MATPDVGTSPTFDTLAAMGLSEVRLRILHLASRRDFVTANDLVTELDIKRSTVQEHVKALVAGGLLNESAGHAADGRRRLQWALDRDAALAALESYRRLLEH